MGYISEDYCSEELSGMLMEKGYIGATNTYLGKDDFNIEQITLQSAMKWLREAHHIMISIRLFNSSEPFWEDNPHQFTVDIATKSLPSKAGHLRGIYSTYEEACKAAIKYCLENLI